MLPAEALLLVPLREPTFLASCEGEGGEAQRGREEVPGARSLIEVDVCSSFRAKIDQSKLYELQIK